MTLGLSLHGTEKVGSFVGSPVALIGGVEDGLSIRDTMAQQGMKEWLETAPGICEPARQRSLCP